MMHMTSSTSSGGEEHDPAKLKDLMRSFHGPQAVDHQIRQAISTCWLLLPDERRTPDILESEIRRIVDRALKNFKEDSQSFGA